MAWPALQELLTLHVDASMRRDELLEECRRVRRDAGQRAMARRALAAAELHELLTALEAAVRRGP
jgi:hypothetical protein